MIPTALRSYYSQNVFGQVVAGQIEVVVVEVAWLLRTVGRINSAVQPRNYIQRYSFSIYRAHDISRKSNAREYIYISKVWR